MGAAGSDGDVMYARCTVRGEAIANGDFRMIACQIERLRAAAPDGAALIVAPASPANAWYRLGDAVDVIAVPPERVDVQAVLYVQSASGL